MQFEYFRKHDSSLLTSSSYAGEMFFSDNFDAQVATRGIPVPPSPDCALRVRLWESPDSCRRVWGDMYHRGDVLPGDASQALLDLFRYVVKEAACEAHVTLAKLCARIAHRSTRPGSSRVS